MKPATHESASPASSALAAVESSLHLAPALACVVDSAGTATGAIEAALMPAAVVSAISISFTVRQKELGPWSGPACARRLRGVSQIDPKILQTLMALFQCSLQELGVFTAMRELGIKLCKGSIGAHAEVLKAELFDCVRQAINLQHELGIGAVQLLVIHVTHSRKPWQKHHEAPQGRGH